METFALATRGLVVSTTSSQGSSRADAGVGSPRAATVDARVSDGLARSPGTPG
jgi:hypothetical protein